MTAIAPGLCLCHAERSAASCAAQHLPVCWDTILRSAQDAICCGQDAIRSVQGARRFAQDAIRSGDASAPDDRQRGSYGGPLGLVHNVAIDDMQ